METLSIINNFISKETCLLIHDNLKKYVLHSPPDENHPGGIQRFSIKDPTIKKIETQLISDSLIFDIIKLLVDSVSNQFNIQKSKIETDRVSYTLLKQNQSIPYHNDFGINKNKTVYSALLYLNNDYEGGEICFYENKNDPSTANIPTKYKFDVGTLVYFNGTNGPHHEVLQVGSGERASMVFFFVNKD
jgi:uncharacterized protein (UPF0248 family)